MFDCLQRSEVGRGSYGLVTGSKWLDGARDGLLPDDRRQTVYLVSMVSVRFYDRVEGYCLLSC